MKEYDGPRFCWKCGHPLAQVDYGKHEMLCPNSKCDTFTYRNALPVSNVIIPYRGGIFMEKRSIDPGINGWTLPGGHQMLESWQWAERREAGEEIYVYIPDPRINIQPFWFDSTPNGEHLVTFGLVRPGTNIMVCDFAPNREVSERMILMPEQWPRFSEHVPFRLHRMAIARYFQGKTL